MKKIVLILCIFACYFSAHAQTLTASPTTVTSGGTVTLTGSGETAASHFWYAEDLLATSAASPNQSLLAKADGATIGTLTNANFYDASPKHVTAFTVKLVNTGTVPLTVTYSILMGLYDTPTITDLTPKTCSFTVTVNPAPSIFYNTASSGTLYNNTCSAGSTSNPYNYSVAAGTVSSTVSVADANSKAIAAQQALANANNPCFVIPAPSISVSGAGTTVTNNTLPITFAVIVPTNACTSTKITAVDQMTGAPALSVTSGQPNTASVVLPLTTGHTYSVTATCYGPGYTAGISSTAIPYTVSGTAPTYYNVAASATYTKNNCTVGTGTAYTYTVPAGTYSSQLSQAAADAQAQTDLTNNGQTQANLNGQCITSMPFTITNNTQELGYQLKFVGPTTIYYNIPPGGSTVVQVPFGTYTVSVIPTGGNQNNYSYTLAGMQSNTGQFIFTNITIYIGSPDSSFLMKPI